MQVSHTRPVVSASFDDPNLVSAGGLVPVLALAEKSGLRSLADQWVTVPTDKGANAGLKIASLVGGMVAGADSIDDMALLRHGGMGKLFDRGYAPSTLGSFLRSFTFGHVRQLEAVATRFLHGLAGHTPVVKGLEDYALVDVDDTIVEVHGYQKQGSGYGYSGVRGLNAVLATVSTDEAAPVIVGSRLRKGSTGSPRGAAKLITDTLGAVARLRSCEAQAGPVLLRADSAYCNQKVVASALAAGAAVSITARADKRVKAAISTIDESAWTKIEYPNSVYDEDSGHWISEAEVAEVPFTAFTSRKKAEHVVGRLVVRRIPELNKPAPKDQGSLFQTHRFHPVFTTSGLNTVAADKTHRAHAVIEQINSDLKNSALAHLPSGDFAANSAWLTAAVMAFNLTRAAATLTGKELAKATTPTIRQKLINIPARIATSARKIRLHLPQNWPWETAWTTLFDAARGPTAAATA
ncbi:IS1380 family transposase [Arthrobacter sp. H14]|uniref:IS1380 family transposase n=1 Tax=Arthrobacter sp. H14 TaxID=1312959 RepID=UPI00047C98E4|nr:IS1380 family transposase [Arthrobacter sp. H14]